MVKFKAKEKDCQLIVTVSLGFRESFNETDLGFFSQKYVRGLFRANQINKRKVEYFGPVGIPLADRLKYTITKHDFFVIVEQFVELAAKLQESNLMLNRVVFDMKHIYINEQTRSLNFIYLPIEGQVNNVNMLEVLNQVTCLAKPIDSEDQEYIPKFFYFLQNQSCFDVEQITAYISKEEIKVGNIIKKHNYNSSAYLTDKPKDFYEHEEQIAKKITPTVVPARNKSVAPVSVIEEEEEEATGLLFEEEEEATGLLMEEEVEEESETTLLVDEEEEATTILVEEVKHYPTLVRETNGEVITINKAVFRLGKDRTNSDYPINNPSVSRSHADIITRGNSYSIMDLNSTNRTYVNDAPIAPKEEISLNDGDVIVLSNEVFRFNI